MNLLCLQLLSDLARCHSAEDYFCVADDRQIFGGKYAAEMSRWYFPFHLTAASAYVMAMG